MNFRLFTVLVGALALAGCANQSKAPSPTSAPAGSPSPTALAAATSPAQTSGTTVASATDPLKAGQADLKRHNYPDAEREFNRAIAGNHNAAAAYAGLGSSAELQGRYKDAYRSYKQAATRAPQNAGYAYQAAVSALYALDYKGAVRYATTAIKLQPASAAPYHVRMLAYGRLYDVKLQLKDALRIAKLQPRDPEAFDDLGIAYANNHKYYQAISAFSQAITRQPKNYRYYSNRAVVENVIKDKQKAIADVHTAMMLTPDPGEKKILKSELGELKSQS